MQIKQFTKTLYAFQSTLQCALYTHYTRSYIHRWTPYVLNNEDQVVPQSRVCCSTFSPLHFCVYLAILVSTADPHPPSIQFERKTCKWQMKSFNAMAFVVRKFSIKLVGGPMRYNWLYQTHTHFHIPFPTFCYRINEQHALSPFEHVISDHVCPSSHITYFQNVWPQLLFITCYISSVHLALAPLRGVCVCVFSSKQSHAYS